MTLQGYWTAARAPRYSLLFVAPLFALYEIASWALGADQAGGVRNGADVLLRSLFALLGGHRGLAVFTLAVAVVGGVLVWRDHQRHPGPLRPDTFALMLAESLVWAVLLGGVAASITALVLDPLAVQAGNITTLSLSQRLVLSAGAGIYEELVFRVMLVGGITALGMNLRWARRWAVTSGVLGSALIFAAFHYVGPYGDAFVPWSFTFRTVAGVLLSLLYVVRGYGIAVWAHFLYDVMVLTA